MLLHQPDEQRRAQVQRHCVAEIAVHGGQHASRQRKQRRHRAKQTAAVAPAQKPCGGKQCQPPVQAGGDDDAVERIRVQGLRKGLEPDAHLFESEVMEIYEHTVEIVNIVREAGYRTKMVVRSEDPNVDPIGACVGMRGARVKNVVNELNREKIDILEYSDDKAAMVQESLAPIDPIKIDVDTENRVVTVYVADDKAAAKAKGRKGQNVRLTARLISAPNDKWDVRVEPYDNMTRTKSLATEGANELVTVLDVSPELAANMIAAGFTTVQGIASYVQPEDLVDALGISEDQAFAIVDKAKNA